MSAIRGPNRRATRTHNSSPYAAARPAPKKKSSWTFGIGGILSYFNPLRSRASAEEDEEDLDSSQDDSQGMQVSKHSSGGSSPTDTLMRSPNDPLPPPKANSTQNPAASLSARGHQLATSVKQSSSSDHTNLNDGFSTPPRVTSGSPPDGANLSPAESIDKVRQFLKEKEGQTLSEWETRGLITFLEKNVTATNDKPEPFRFSTSPSRTPVRGNSPIFTLGTPGVSPNNPNGDSPRRTLSKNPNGVYRWQGGGSARPRNRYQSPSFGTRSPPPAIKLSPVKTDTKRRRVGEDAESSSGQKVPFPAVSPQKPANGSAPTPAPNQTPAPSQTRLSIFPATNGTPASQPNGNSTQKTPAATAPRLRTGNLPSKPTAPSIPSPLRQAWGQSDSPPQTPGSNANPRLPKPATTKAASFMTELIKEVTPPKKPDVSNPYQTASPVRPTPKKPTPKRPRASAVKAAPPPVPDVPKVAEPSPQAIIEATVPKGSKRSRPPPELLKSNRGDSAASSRSTLSPPPAPVPSRRSPRRSPVELPSVNGHSASPSEVEEVIDDDDSRATKKQKKSPTKESVVTIEEIEDVDMPSSSKSSSFSHPSEIIEPSENSGAKSPPSSTSPVKSTLGMKSTAPKEPSKLRFSYQVDRPETPPDPVASAAAAALFDPPPAPKPAPASLPGTLFPAASKPIPAALPVRDIKQTVIAMAVTDLPTYNFPSTSSGIFGPAQIAAKAKPVTSLPPFDFSTPIKAPTSTSGGFNWAAAGIKAPSAPSGGGWKCDTCMCDNPADATAKCTVCETPRKGAAPEKPTVKGFDWGAAGIKAPVATGEWTCSLCSLSNPASATSKCLTCDQPR